MDSYGIERRSTSEAVALAALDQHPSVYFDARGYLTVQTTHRGERLRARLHRLLAVAEYGFDAVVDRHVHHRNGFEMDNRPSNIRVMDPSDHKSHHTRKMSWLDKLRAVEMYAGGDCTQAVVADQFGVDASTISRAVTEIGGANRPD